jgi:hypothetical protein
MSERKWAVVLLGTESPKHELAKFRAFGDAYRYAKDLAGREGISSNVWVSDFQGKTSIVRGG